MSKKRRFISDAQVIDIQQSKLAHKFQHVSLIPRNPNQKIYLQKIRNDDKNIIFAIGPAGTGKTILAVLNGIKLYQEGAIDKIIITRPAVSTDEDLGALPGDINEKMAPWTRPIFDIFYDYYHRKDVTKMMDDGIIEISPLSYMRGRTFHNAYIIADECQCCTVNQMKMLLTRIGDNSKMIITGDLAQADRGYENGLYDIMQRLERHSPKYIDFIRFTHTDIERHPAVGEVLTLYGDSD